MKTEIITLGGGCFWCIESAYNSVEGVVQALSGYMGGMTSNPTYEDVCSGQTGHAEVVQVEFNPDSITAREVLEIFFALHDPTQLNQQGNDVGTQYRSVIYYHSEEQLSLSKELIQSIEDDGIWKDPVVTEVIPAQTFFVAEAYHQDYVSRNPQNGYCQAVVSPKLKKFRDTFRSKLKGHG